MDLLGCFEYVTNQIHSVIVATVDADGNPETRVIDLLGCDENGLYFTTSAGKNFHKQLLANPHVAFSGLKGSTTTECVAVSVKGEVREETAERVNQLFDAYPYMRDLYPTAESLSTVRVFCIYRGSLQWYDFGKKPLERLSFTFGGVEVDVAARKQTLAARLIEMLSVELHLGEIAVPEDPARKDVLIEDLLKLHSDKPLSTDLIEVLQLYRG